MLIFKIIIVCYIFFKSLQYFIDNFTLIITLLNVLSYLVIFNLNLIVLPLYICTYLLQLVFYIILLFYKKIIGVGIYPFQSFKMKFSQKLSFWCFLKIMLYIPRYIAYCTIINFLKLNKKKIKLSNFYWFIFTRIWVHFTGIPIFLFNLTIFYKQLFAYMWLYYNEENFGTYFINKLNLFFKKK